MWQELQPLEKKAPKALSLPSSSCLCKASSLTALLSLTVAWKDILCLFKVLLIKLMTFTQHLLSKSHSSTCSKDTETHRPWHGFPSTKMNVLWLLFYKGALDAWHVLLVLAAKKVSHPLTHTCHLVFPILLARVFAPSCPTLCDPMDCSPLGSSVCGIFQRILEWLPSPGNLPKGESPGDPGDQTHISAISWTGRWILYHRAPGKPCLSHKCFHPNEEKPAFPPPTTTIQSVHALFFKQTVMTVFCRKRLSLNSYLI